MKLKYQDLVSLLDKHFFGNSDIVVLSDVLELIRQNFGFQFTCIEILQLISTVNEFELTYVNQPNSPDVVLCLWDRRRMNSKIVQAEIRAPQIQ